jgi:hypothetical protein
VVIELADITMCSSENCIYKDECYRQTAKVDDLQSWYNFEYECMADKGYSNYIKNYNKIKSQTTDMQFVSGKKIINTYDYNKKEELK